MLLSDFHFELPPDRIAQRPAPVRDGAKMMVLSPGSEAPVDSTAGRLADHLRAGDLLVVNDSKVFPARVEGRLETGGAVEALFLHPVGEGRRWLLLVRPSKKIAPGVRLLFPAIDMECVALSPGGEGKWIVRLGGDADPFEALERFGAVPLPPYIRREPDEADRERYQTVYAREKGSVAAPTAGLHFTRELIDRLEHAGIGFAAVTLHVGPGTFRPIRTERIEDHTIEPERYAIPEETARRVEETKKRGGRVIAVGTTAVRTLEGASENGRVRAGSGRTGLYIHPPYTPSVVDGLLTNFHLPGSSLFLLVCALGGTERMKSAYRLAVKRGYRFYSYGDCCLLLQDSNDSGGSPSFSG